MSEVLRLETPPINAAFSRAASTSEAPFRFAEPFEVQVTPTGYGRWEATADGKTAVWRLRVVSPGAVSINLGFTRYRMPPDGSLRVYTPDGSEAIRPFTDADNEDHGELWTPIVSGEEAVIEVAVPAARVGELELELGSVNRGFRQFSTLQQVDRSCMVDVACSSADPYRDQVRSTVVIVTGGHSLCSGALLNNTARDGRPYIITSERCTSYNQPSHAARNVVYWNYESPACGDRSSEALQQFQTGAYVRARNYSTSVVLIELDDELDPDFNAYHAGWDRTDEEVTSAFALFHPHADVKSINIASGGATVGPWRLHTPPADGYLIVNEWDQGSSVGAFGGGLFNQDKRLVAVFREGARRCGNSYGGAWGRLAKSWNSLRSWLDPENTGETTIDGMDWNAPPKKAATLDDQALRLSDPEEERALSVDVSYGFHDREGDTLTYTASSSDEAKATVTVSGSTVTIAPVATGAATVTVTATDADGANTAATLEFEATVGDNRSPEPAGKLTARSLPIAAGAIELDVSGSFTDKNSDTLTYAASSSADAVARVSMSGSTLTVTPRRPGPATVTVTATDADGSNTSARQWFEVTVPNRAPVAAGTMPALNLHVGRGSRDISLMGRFSDPDGDRLFYRATSSNESVAMATASAPRLDLPTLIPVAPVSVGTATVTVTATDTGRSNMSATHAFDVTVPNRSPGTLGVLPALSLRVETGAASLDAGSAFNDPDGDDLTYTASSSNESVATATASNSVVTVTPMSAGTVTVTVTATDVEGSNRSATQTFTATVANRAPRAVGSLVGPDLQVGDGNREVAVAAAFDDADGDTLTYSASSSAPAVAAKSVSGSTVTLTPLARGTATITVSATDLTGSNTPATVSFDVRVKARRGVTVAPGVLTVNEGATAAYTVVLNSEPTGPVTVTPSVGTNTEVSVDPPAVTLGVGDWDRPVTVTVEASHDQDALADAPVTVTHQVAGADYGPVSASSVQVTVVEDDAPTLSIQPPGPVSENDGRLVFQVTLSTASSSEVTVDYATSNGSGAAGARAVSDYTAASGALTFTANSTTPQEIAIEIVDDGDDEVETETFRLTLRNPRNASLAGGGQSLQVTGTIEDDDDPEVEVSFGSANYGVTEGGTVTVVVRLSSDPERDLDAGLLRTHHGGTTEADYSGVPSSVTFGPGVRTQEFLFAATDDSADDDGESVVLSFVSLPTRVSGGGETTLAIQDNDGSGNPGSPGSPGSPGGPGGDDKDDEDDDEDDGGGTQPPPPPPSSGPPKVDFTLTAECAGELCRARTDVPVTFEDTSTGRAQSRRWDFGDGTASRNRRIAHAWSSPGFYEVTLSVSDGTTESVTSRVFLVEASDPAGTCEADSQTLCLQDSRYAVGVEWWTAGGASGAGSVFHAGTNDSGLFTFFDRENWEILIKVLDGCAVNGHMWVYGASTTDLGYTIRVTDTVTGMAKEYRNEPGQPAPAITDATAFAQGC